MARRTGNERARDRSATGEGPTLTGAERQRLTRLCVEVSAGRIPVLAATGTNRTEATIAATRAALVAGADAALVATPAYSRPSQEGLYRHFEAVARAVDLPILVQIDPARTGVDLHPATIERLSRLAGIAGFCDAGPDPLRLLTVSGSELWRLCGSDRHGFAFAAAGG